MPEPLHILDFERAEINDERMPKSSVLGANQKEGLRRAIISESLCPSMRRRLVGQVVIISLRSIIDLAL